VDLHLPVRPKARSRVVGMLASLFGPAPRHVPYV
jgi:hypothetical protein